LNATTFKKTISCDEQSTVILIRRHEVCILPQDMEITKITQTESKYLKIWSLS